MKAIGSYITLAALLTAATAAVAQGPGRMGPDAGPGFGMHRPPMEDALGPRGTHGRWWNDPEIVDKLKLTEDQRKSMDAILLEHREKLVDLRATVEKAEIGLEPLMESEHPNEQQILAQIDKVAQARAELEKGNARFLLALRSKLSPDQWKQLRAERVNRMDRMHHRMPEGRDGQPRRGDGAGPGSGGPGGRPGGGAPGPQSMLMDPGHLAPGGPPLSDASPADLVPAED